MLSIQKVLDAQANAIIDPYLDYAREQSWFQQPGYKGKADLYRHHFTNQVGKGHLITSVLLPEQAGRCCYCMKRLDVSGDLKDVTLEHAIPRSTPPGTAFTNYFRLGYSGLSAIHVCHTLDYKAGTSLSSQYPHQVAYHNFLIACKKCNNRRGDAEIGFPNLLPPAEQHLVYHRTTGTISWMNDPKLFDGAPEAVYMVNVLDLNRPMLKAIRALWLYGKDHPTPHYATPDTVQAERDRRDLIYRTFGAAMAAAGDEFTEADLQAFLALNTPQMWGEVLKYDYFASL